MKKGLAIISCIIVIIIILSGFIYFRYFEESNDKNLDNNKEYHITLEPEVRVTNKIYYQINISESFWTPPIYDKFNKEYGEKYSEGLKNEIIDCIKNKSAELGEDPDVLETCLFIMGPFYEPGYRSIPCLAEKAQLEYYVNYKGSDSTSFKDLNESERGPKNIEPCWIFVINWGFRYLFVDYF
jgi:hypothetical protein